MMILPPALLGILGGGQLGQMFTIAARRMGYRVLVVDPDPYSPAASFANFHICKPYDDKDAIEKISQCAAITTEFENVPAKTLSILEQTCKVHPSSQCVTIAQDRILEKTFLKKHGFPTSPFIVIQSQEDFQTASFPALLKTARFGYDGKGQAKVENAKEASMIYRQWKEPPCILETFLDIACEISVILVRNQDQQVAYFPIAENQHQSGILSMSIVPARISQALTDEAIALATRLAKMMDYVGVLAVEYFVLSDGTLLINEIAPRPHNSGHYTLDACASSQFEQQVRSLCGLTLSETTLHTPAVMVNLLGDLWSSGEPFWATLLSSASVKLHLYGKKEPRPGRKMGHYTVIGPKALSIALETQDKMNGQ